MNKSEKDKAYQEKVKDRAPKSKTLQMCLQAFLVGGVICCIGELIRDAGEGWLHLSGDTLSAFTSIVLIFAGATLTGVGIYDKIAKFAGAGSVVPITGFANSVAAPAMEFRNEGFVMGVGAKMFILAGPVLAYGIASSVLVGLLSLIFH